MMDIKLGKAMATDNLPEGQSEGASNPFTAMDSAQIRSHASLAYACSYPRNRLGAVRDLPKSARPACWEANQLRGVHVEKLRAAARFAHERGYPLNLCIDINWTRTWLGDDPDGQVLRALMQLCRKWLKPRYCAVFALIAVRENPDRRSNTHVLVHCPPAVLRPFKRQVRSVLNDACRRLERGAVKFTLVGKGNATIEAALGKLLYMSKGTPPEEAMKHGIRPVPQGSIYGKPYSISQDIHRAARRRHAEGAEG